MKNTPSSLCTFSLPFVVVKREEKLVNGEQTALEKRIPRLTQQPFPSVSPKARKEEVD